MDACLQYECVALKSTEIGSDRITCFQVSGKLLAVGRESGRVDLMDYNGDVIKCFHEHCASVRDVCFDSTSSEYLASCSDDGCAIIYSLYQDSGCIKKYVVGSGDCRLSAVALDPRCSTRKTKELVVGDECGRVYFLSSGWLGQTETLLFSGKYVIDSILWSGTLVAWASMSGVRLYDVSCHAPLGTIAADSSRNARDRITMLHCVERKDMLYSLPRGGSFGPQRDLFLGSVSAIYHVQVSQSTVDRVELEGSLEKSLLFEANDNQDIISSFSVDQLNSCGAFRLHVLTMCNQVCRICELDTSSLSLKVIYDGSIPSLSENSKLYLSENPSHSPDSGEPLFFIQTSQAVTMAKSLDAVTRLGYLCRAGKYGDAMILIETNKEIQSYRDDVLEKYMNHFVEAESSENAGMLAAMLLGDDISAWERWITILARAKKLHHIAVHLPYQTKDGRMLSKATYDLVIKSCLQQRKYETTTILVQTWPIDLYDAGSILAMANERLDSEGETSKNLYNTVIDIYSKLGMHRHAIELFISKSDPRVFDYIQNHKQFVGFKLANLVADLMEIDSLKATRVLVDNYDVATPPEVVSAIFVADGQHKRTTITEMTDIWAVRLYDYLRLLHKEDPSFSDFDTLLVELCPKLDPENMMSLLQSSNSYNLERALKSCVQHDLLQGQVFILGRMGLIVDALDIILNKMHNVSAAVEFARDRMDSALWDELSRLASLNKDLASELLGSSGDGIDAGKLLESISPEMCIPDLKQRLICAFGRIKQEVELQRSCLLNAHTDCTQLLYQLYKDISVALNNLVWDKENEMPVLCYKDQCYN